jgi:hypothetical protein
MKQDLQPPHRDELDLIQAMDLPQFVCLLAHGQSVSRLENTSEIGLMSYGRPFLPSFCHHNGMDVYPLRTYLLTAPT